MSHTASTATVVNAQKTHLFKPIIHPTLEHCAPQPAALTPDYWMKQRFSSRSRTEDQKHTTQHSEIAIFKTKPTLSPTIIARGGDCGNETSGYVDAALLLTRKIDIA